MTTFTAEIIWERGEQDFLKNRYSRQHVINFDGGLSIPASSSPHVVPMPMSDPFAADPEELFVASIANCHMLWFLSIASGKKFVVDRYKDNPAGVMQKNEQGNVAVTHCVLRPAVTFSGNHVPTKHEIVAMHDEAHHQCFIANSVTTKITCEPI
jgi:organic hydroperoxide reductase OsmC/OhrA